MFRESVQLGVYSGINLSNALLTLPLNGYTRKYLYYMFLYRGMVLLMVIIQQMRYKCYGSPSVTHVPLK